MKDSTFNILSLILFVAIVVSFIFFNWKIALIPLILDISIIIYKGLQLKKESNYVKSKQFKK